MRVELQLASSLWLVRDRRDDERETFLVGEMDGGRGGEVRV